MRYATKGGVWKNTEDEILKAAVMKYGKNQWSRISSLLVRKTAKQCKSRWYEWLDPSIKKTEWTREEDEKLLHLAKIMPTQWRTIAPIIGRTAAQCLERYEQLLDAAQGKDAPSNIASNDDPRRLRPGEIDPLPEAKPARPDPIDMDEDEKEMLSEARARLANTKGKKAKRKAREKQIEEARRLASLQKRRELKAAGVELRDRKRRRNHLLDLRTEVPFEHQAPKGFFDTSDDKKRSLELKKDGDFLGKNISDIDGKGNVDQEEDLRKKDAKRQKLMKKTNLPQYIAQVNELNDPKLSNRRTPLVLPAPQITDQELEDIQKMGGLAAVQAAASNAATSLGTRGTPTPMRGARTPMQGDNIMMEAQNLLALTRAETPLKGGENTPLHPSDFSGITPAKKNIATPNPLATPLRKGGMTPVSKSGNMTPVRDELNINTPDRVGLALSDSRSLQKQQKLLRQSLKNNLQALPKPTNDYAIVMPELPAEDYANKNNEREMDMEDILAQKEARRLADEAEELRKRSQAIQHGLPRPLQVNPSTNVARHISSRSDSVLDLIQQEMLTMLRYDAAMYPVVNDGKKLSVPLSWQDMSEQSIIEARNLISKEYAQLQEEGVVPSIEAFVSAHDQVLRDSVYLPSSRKYVSLTQCTQDEKLKVLQQELALLNEHLGNEDKIASKAEQKVGLLIRGYEQIANKTIQNINQTHYTLLDTQNDLSCFRVLQQQEKIATPIRIENLKNEVAQVKQQESKLQARYAALLAESQSLRITLATTSNMSS